MFENALLGWSRISLFKVVEVICALRDRHLVEMLFFVFFIHLAKWLNQWVIIESLTCHVFFLKIQDEWYSIFLSHFVLMKRSCLPMLNIVNKMFCNRIFIWTFKLIPPIALVNIRGRSVGFIREVSLGYS